MRYTLLNALAILMLTAGTVTAVAGLLIMPFTIGPSMVWVGILGLGSAVLAPVVGTWAEESGAVAKARERYNHDGEKSPREEKKLLKKRRSDIRGRIYGNIGNTAKQDNLYQELLGVEAELKNFKTTRKVKI